MKIWKAIVIFLGGIGIGVGISNVMSKQNKKKTEKYSRFYRLYESWLMLKLCGGKLVDFFNKNGIKSIAVYGYGSVGRTLVKELETTDIKITGIIDRKKTTKTDGISLYSPDDAFPDTDAIVITPFVDEKEIEDSLRKKYNGKILYIEDIVYDCI